jgi:HD-like signal output (HDOD) protein
MSVEAPVQSDVIVEKAIASIGEIATLPEIVTKIIDVVGDPKSTARDLHEIIKNDPALSARILKVVNSAFYGLPGQISTVDRAIIMLGLSAVKNIAIAASITKLFRNRKLGGKFTARDLWTHSLAVGAASRSIAKAAGYPSIEDAFLAGLIHDLGLLVARQAFGEKISEVIALCLDGKNFCQAELDTIGVTHEMLGQALTTKWKFPMSLRAVTGFHHDPTRVAEQSRVLADIVHVGDYLSSQQKHGFYLTAADQPLQEQALAGTKLSTEQIQEVSDQLPEQLAEAETLFSAA